MKTPLRIVLEDRDSFFLLGMQAILTEHLFTRHGPIIFFPVVLGNEADLIVTSYEKGHIALFGDRITFFNRKNCLLAKIHRKEKIEVIKRILDQLFGDVFAAENIQPSICAAAKLTLREQQILAAIWSESPIAQIARNLNISAKTVYIYKYKIMKKLGFESNHELYNWLRSGGLG